MGEMPIELNVLKIADSFLFFSLFSSSLKDSETSDVHLYCLHFAYHKYKIIIINGKILRESQTVNMLKCGNVFDLNKTRLKVNSSVALVEKNVNFI